MVVGGIDALGFIVSGPIIQRINPFKACTRLQMLTATVLLIKLVNVMTVQDGMVNLAGVLLIFLMQGFVTNCFYLIHSLIVKPHL
mmetsp:Transcript_8435/g.14131  ORF Transcript_8435/g.14131 Transcript_8435/m.14131 type:complete len:85 (+) Transcript_8435:1849-2103(+)